MTWKYRNDTKRIIIYRNEIWRPDEERETLYPVPSSLGLTCTQEGSSPDPVLFHDDVQIGAGEEKIITLDAPTNSPNLALSLLCMTPNAYFECRFNHAANKAIPIGIRGFSQVLSWELCSRIILHNVSDVEGYISVTAIEVIS